MKTIKVIFRSVILFALVFPGCDLFSTREPEQPKSPRSNYVTATSADLLLQNFRSSFKDKVTENYISCFSEKKFSFIPSAGSVSKYAFLLNWTVQDERQYFNNMVNGIPKDSIISLRLEKEERNFYGDSASYSAHYSLSVPFTDEQKPKQYQGNLHFTILRDEKLQWSISYWLDSKDSDLPSWSDLKGRLN